MAKIMVASSWKKILRILLKHQKELASLIIESASDMNNTLATSPDSEESMREADLIKLENAMQRQSHLLQAISNIMKTPLLPF